MGPAAGRLPAECLRPDRLVVAAAAVASTGLAPGRARSGRLAEHVLAALRDVLAGYRGPGLLDRRARRSWAPLHGRLRERLGGRRAALRVDNLGHGTPTTTDRRRVTCAPHPGPHREWRPGRRSAASAREWPQRWSWGRWSPSISRSTCSRVHGG